MRDLVDTEHPSAGTSPTVSLRSIAIPAGSDLKHGVEERKSCASCRGSHLTMQYRDRGRRLTHLGRVVRRPRTPQPYRRPTPSALADYPVAPKAAICSRLMTR